MSIIAERLCAQLQAGGSFPRHGGDQLPDRHDLDRLDPYSFEHLVTSLALRVLGPSLSTFGPGSDGGRDGYYEGSAPYPSKSERWSGRWYIQAKFHKPHLSIDPQKWLLDQIRGELKLFREKQSRRVWPDNWIIATNIDPSGKPLTGSFDAARGLVKAAHPALATKFHIWGGQKILQLLIDFPEVAEHYGHFLTPGNLIASLYSEISESRAQIKDIVRSFTVREFWLPSLSTQR